MEIPPNKDILMPGILTQGYHEPVINIYLPNHMDEIEDKLHYTPLLGDVGVFFGTRQFHGPSLLAHVKTASSCEDCNPT